ncbi:MAG TPA: APC family permease [Planctomycetota bacterium]|nr:APC family permease [Planctomycetota bacterium]
MFAFRRRASPSPDLYDTRLGERVTIGVFAAWIAMGGDLLGSCMYGPEILGRAAGEHRAVLMAAGAATIATLALFAWSYLRMVAHFPDGGGGYTAAKGAGFPRLAVVSGVALGIDAPLTVAVAAVSCADAVSAAFPGVEALRVPIALALIGMLTVLNLRGVKESVAVLAPIVVAFVVSHLAVLGVGLWARAQAVPAAIAAIPGELGAIADEGGGMGLAWTMLRAYAVGGAIYTGLEVLSNGVPLLREPKQRTARRTMLLLAGVPAAVIAVIVIGYAVFAIGPGAGATLNGALFARIAESLGVGVGWPRTLLVTVPLMCEAALLVVAAQSGMVHGPRALNAMAADGYVPKRFVRLNARLAPAPAILLICGGAALATLALRGDIEPLLVGFVVSVFVTFTISQWALIRHAVARRRADATWSRDCALHLIALLACLVILGGTAVRAPLGSAIAAALVGVATLLSFAIHRRYRAQDEAVRRVAGEATATPAAVPRAAAASAVLGAGPPVIVLLVGNHPQLASVALAWIAALRLPVRDLILASTALADADSIQSPELLRAAEVRCAAALEPLVARARALRLPARAVVRRGADVLESTVALVLDLVRDRREPCLVVGFRSSLGSSAVEALLRDDLAIAMQDRLEAEKVAMVVLSVPVKHDRGDREPGDREHA